MKIVKYEDVIPFIGYIKLDSVGVIRYYFADIDNGDTGARKISIDDLIVADLALYKAIHKMTGANTAQADLQAYFEYIDMKYPTYSYY